MEEIRRIGIAKIIDRELGTRPKQSTYSYSDAILFWINSILCGADRLEDSNMTKPHIREVNSTKCPSPDSIAHIFKKLATVTDIIESPNSSAQFNINFPMNRLLIKIALELNLIKRDDCTLDYDNTIIPCKKSYDEACNLTYKKNEGYCAGLSCIGNVPVYVENRSGNANASMKMADTLQRSIKLLAEQNIYPKRFRSDSAAYSKEVINLIEEKGMEMFIRAKHSERLFQDIIHTGVWVDTYIGNRPLQVASTIYEFDGRNYRLVVQREKHNSKDFKNKHTNDGYSYYAIITNNKTMSDREVVVYYNQRATQERLIDDLKRDFHWTNPPFSFMNQNAVYMVVGAIGCLIYRHLIKIFSRKLKFVRKTYQLKNFIFHFISITLEWETKEGENIPILRSDCNRDYSPLWKRSPP